MKRKEIGRRLGSISFLLSQAREVFQNAWDSFSQEQFCKLYRTVRPYTMCSNARLRGLYEAVQYVVAKKIAGDVVECGTARGGSAALMGLALKQLGENRTLWVFDTFEGLPAPTDADPDVEIARLYTGSCRGAFDEVSVLFDRVGILAQSRLIKGLVQDTLPLSEVEKIAVLHLDTDWYDSVKVCLDQLYDRVSPGGVIQIDDYGHWEGARHAVDDFLRERSISSRLTTLDYTGRQWVK